MINLMPTHENGFVLISIYVIITAPSEMTALEYVITSAQEEIARLDAMIEEILVTEGPER